MKKIIIVIWTIIIILSSFIFCIKISLIKLKRNNNISENKKDSVNESFNPVDKNKKIIFQIDILKNTMLMNNYIFKNYNKIFSHNINYITYQKNIIKRKIDIANNSICQELNILNEMKNILENHPYNYLQLFQDNNYYIPDISLNNNRKISNNIKNIKCFSSKLNKKYANISSIFYQSEENTVGADKTISLITTVRLLIFKKVNFKYSNILYFSHNLNNLSTLNKYHKNRHLKVKNNLINNIKTNYKSESNDNKHNTKYLKNKLYIYITPFFLIGLISVFIMAGGKGERARRYLKLGRRVPNNPNQSKLKELNSLENTEEKSSVNNNGINESQSDEYLTDRISYVDARSMEDSQSYIFRPDKTVKSTSNMIDHDISTEKEMFDISTDNELDESGDMLAWVSPFNSMDFDDLYSQITDYPPVPDEFMDVKWKSASPDSIHSENYSISNMKKEDISSLKVNSRNDKDESGTVQDEYIEVQEKGINELVSTSSTKHSKIVSGLRKRTLLDDNIDKIIKEETNNWKKYTKGLKITKDSNFYTIESTEFPAGIPAFINLSSKHRPKLIPILHTYNPGSVIPEYFTKGPEFFLLHSKEKEIALVKKWFGKINVMREIFCNILYKHRKYGQMCSTNNFLVQMHSYFYQLDLSSKEQWTRPNSHSIFSYINDKVDSSTNNALTEDEEYIALAYIKHITKFELRQEAITTNTFTTHGWFRLPSIYQKRNINSNNITKEDYEYLQKQLKKLNNIELLLPETFKTSEYHKILLYEIKTNKINPDISQLNKFIANEILNDLKEVVRRYKSLINIKDINKDELPKKLKKRIKFPDYLWKFSHNTFLERNGYDGISHNGISEDLLFTLFDIF